MRVIGVDLGNPLGLGLIEGDSGNALSAKALTAVLAKPRTPERLEDDLMEFFAENPADLAVCETPGKWGRVSIGMAQRAAYTVLRLVCRRHKVTLTTYQPSRIRAMFNLSRKANKGRLHRAAMAIIGGEFAHLGEHPMDALCQAMTGLHSWEADEDRRKERNRLKAADRRRRKAAEEGAAA